MSHVRTILVCIYVYYPHQRHRYCHRRPCHCDSEQFNPIKGSSWQTHIHAHLKRLNWLANTNTLTPIERWSWSSTHHAYQESTTMIPTTTQSHSSSHFYNGCWNNTMFVLRASTVFFSLIARLFIFPESIQPHAIGFDIIPIILMMIAIVGVRTSQFLFCCSFNFATLITSQTVLGHSASCRPNPLSVCVPTHLLRLVVIRLTHFFGSRSPFLSSPFFLFTAVQSISVELLALLLHKCNQCQGTMFDCSRYRWSDRYSMFVSECVSVCVPLFE